MRHVILIDNKITDANLAKWKTEDRAFWREYLGMTPKYHVIRHDFSSYPTYPDSDGDMRPTKAYLQSLNDLAVSKYGEFGFDFLVVAVHQDNWRSTNMNGLKGIWGTNYSYQFGNQTLQYCRWDKRLANTFGTIYHERMHSFDAIVEQETGVDINEVLGINNFDRDVVHGKHDDYEYIRWKENTDVVKTIAPYLRKALSTRERRHLDYTNKQKTLIGILQKLVYLLRAKLNQTNGVPRA